MGRDTSPDLLKSRISPQIVKAVSAGLPR
jgi:hypothetical protein